MGIAVEQRLLQRVRLVGGADALDGLDRTAVRLDGEHTARVDRAPVHDDRAGAAFAKVTALLRARQVRALAQHVQKRLLRLHRERAALAVERQVNRVVVFKLMFYLLCRICCMFRIGPFPPLCALRQVSHSPESGRLISSFSPAGIFFPARAQRPSRALFLVWATVYYLFCTKSSV